MEKHEVRPLVQATLEKLLGPNNVVVEIQWKSRFTARAGDATYKLRPCPHGVIRLSLPIWELADDSERYQTVVHETCHVVQMYLHKPGEWTGGPHGYKWQQLMRKCGVKPERCHKVNTAPLKRRRHGEKFVIKCGCREHTLGVIQTKWVKERKKRYRCRLCGQELKYENITQKLLVG